MPLLQCKRQCPALADVKHADVPLISTVHHLLGLGNIRGIGAYHHIMFQPCHGDHESAGMPCHLQGLGGFEEGRGWQAHSLRHQQTSSSGGEPNLAPVLSGGPQLPNRTANGAASAYAHETSTDEEAEPPFRASASISSDSSLNRIFTAQSSLEPVLESWEPPTTTAGGPSSSEAGAPEEQQPGGLKSPLTSYPVRLSPATSDTPGAQWHAGGLEAQAAVQGSDCGGEAARSGALLSGQSSSYMLPSQVSVRPPRPPSGSLQKTPRPPPDARNQDTESQQASSPTVAPTAPPSAFASPGGNAVGSTEPRNSFEERIASGSFASPSASMHADSTPMPPSSAFGASLPHSSSSNSGRGVDFVPGAHAGEGAPSNSLTAGQLYSAAVPVTDVEAQPESLLVMTVSEEGYVWQWDVPLQALFDDEAAAPAFPPAPTMLPTAFSIAAPSKTANAAAPAATASTQPRLCGLLQTLPHSVTTFSVCPVAVGVGMLGMAGGPPSAASGKS